MSTQTITVPGYTGPERRRRLHITDSQFGSIVEAVTDSEQLATIARRVGDVEARLDDGSQRMQRIEDKLDANTSTTTEVRDLLDSGRALFRFASGFASGFGRLARWVGGIAGAAAAVWALIYTATHGGKPPG